jgi:hypothetical protein
MRTVVALFFALLFAGPHVAMSDNLRRAGGLAEDVPARARAVEAVPADRSMLFQLDEGTELTIEADFDPEDPEVLDEPGKRMLNGNATEASIVKAGTAKSAGSYKALCKSSCYRAGCKHYYNYYRVGYYHYFDCYYNGKGCQEC